MVRLPMAVCVSWREVTAEPRRNQRRSEERETRAARENRVSYG